ncbi:MAG: tetratricopeptide repeat protein, partial [Actinomadura sp.]
GWHGHLTLAAALAAARSRMAGLAPAREAVRLAPQEAAPHYMLGWLLQGMGRTRAARRAYNRTLRCDPQHAEALENLGRMNLQSGRVVRSVTLFRAAAAAAPADVDGARHVRRALITMAGYACVAAGLLMFLLALAFDPLAWAIAAGAVIAFGLWAEWVVRKWPPDLRAVASVWMRTDPRFIARIRLTGISLVLALCFGVVTALTGTRLTAILIFSAFAVFMLSALAIVIVDRRPRHRADGVLFDSDDPAYLSGWQNYLVFRALRMSCLLTLVLFGPAVQPEPNWGTRAGLGVPLVAGYAAYLWWLRRRMPTAAGALWRRVPVSAAGLGIGAVVNVAFALAVIGVPDSHRGVLEEPAAGPFVIFFCTLVGQCVWLAVRIRALGLRVAPPADGKDAR